MGGWAKRQTVAIPPLSSQRTTYEVNDYSLGYNSFISNDKFPLKNGASNMWRLAQDARIITLGDYETRKGFDIHSGVAGVALDQALTSITGVADKSFNGVTRLAQKFTPSISGNLVSIQVEMKNDAAATGVVIIAIYSDNAGSPGTQIGLSSLASTAIPTTYGASYEAVYYVSAPALSSTTPYWIVAYVQDTGTGSYKWNSTTTATTAKVSTDSGMTWSSTSYGLHFRELYTANPNGVKGGTRATKSDGTKVTLFAHGNTLYSVDEASGALTALKTGLSSSATLYRFAVVNDIVYYVNGYDGYRKWDFTTESQVNSTNYTDLLVHKGLMFLIRKDDPNRFDFSNFALYETFTSTDFVDVPAPKTGDPIASIISLNGYLLIRTNNRCYTFSGEDNSTFRLDDAPDQKGTFTPDTSVSDKNYNYFLSDDGVYKSNGTQPTLISENIYEDVRSMQNKSKACMAISKGRLYLWFPSAGSNVNNSCYVWDLNYGSGGAETVESLDTDAYVAHAVTSFRDDDQLIVFSSVIGQAYWQELPSNDYNNLGSTINFLLQTHYWTAQSPAVLKEYRYWEPRFGAKTGNYTIDCQFAYDQRDNWQTQSSIGVQGSGPVWGSSSMVWGSFVWGSSAETQGYLYVPGEYRRVAFRYKHFAARQPHSFLGHTMITQTRRIR